MFVGKSLLTLKLFKMFSIGDRFGLAKTFPLQSDAVVMHAEVDFALSH